MQLAILCRILTLVSTCLPLLASVGLASPAEEPWELKSAVPLPERLSIHADHRIRYEYLDNQFRAGLAGSDQVLAIRTRVEIEFRIADWLKAGAELQDSRAYLHDSTTPLGTGMVNTVELLQAYLEFATDGPFGGSQTARLGRMTMDIGSRRLVARNRYRNTSNAFTGLSWEWRAEAGDTFRAFYVLPLQRAPSDRDRLRDNDIEYDEESFDFQFGGLFYAGDLPWGDRGEVYLFGEYETGTFDSGEGEVSPDRRLLTPGLRLLRAPSGGRFDYEFETALQFGESSASPTRGRALDHIAHFHHVELGYTFMYAWSPRLIVHYDYASGDDDPGDGSNERFDTLFGARRFDFGPTSIYGAFARSNINTPGARLAIQPSERWSAFVDYRAVWLASDRDEWVPTGIQDPQGRSGSFVGSQLEFRVRWRLLPGNVLLELGYAHLFAGEFIDDAPNSNQHGDTDYLYTQVVLEL